MIAGFEFGCRAPLLTRREHVVGRGHATAQGWRLLYASDLHLTERRASLVADLATIVENEQPDAVLLGGDLIDRRSGLALLGAGVRAMAQRCPVVAVPGNHDAARGIQLVRGVIGACGGKWLPDADVVLSDTQRPPLHLHACPRAVLASAGLHALVAHHPEVAPRAASLGYDLVLAGHLHGGQCVWWQRGQRLYPGAWFSRWNGLRFALDSTTLLVSRGAADTLPVRFRCPREVLLCHLEGATT